MRQIFRSIHDVTGKGSVRLEPRDAEDIWNIYNLISINDTVVAKTSRRVKELASRETLLLSIKVESIDADVGSKSIRVRGPVNEETKHARIGSYHTHELKPLLTFTLTKEKWDSVHIERLNYSLDPVADADVGAIIMQEGLGNIFVISRSITALRLSVRKEIPTKGDNMRYNRDKSMTKFFSTLMDSAVRHLDWDALKVIMIASPGFVKDQFHEHLLLEASRQDLRTVIQNKNKIILCQSASGHKHALDDVLARPDIQKRLKETKAVGEFQLLDEFHDMLRKDESRAPYGECFVKYASEMGAIDKLLITDSFIRQSNMVARRKYVEFVETVQASGADVTIFSAEHLSGKKLNLMTGIAAILRYGLPMDEVDPDNLI